MKTTLWATLSANGNYARSTPAHPPKAQALADFAAQVAAHRNFIVGRQTFLEFQAQPRRAGSDGGAAFGSADIVVVSRSLALPGVQCVPSPAAALTYLQERGHTSALIAGGARLHNAFLEADLVDELRILIAPTLEDEGLRIVLPPGKQRELQLRTAKELGGGVFQLHYALSNR